MSFINPIKNGYLTSKFGWRDLGFGEEWHQGVDLSRQPNSNVEVMASADGEVIRVGPLDSYGNIVLIKHIINGVHYETNYAHLKSYKVKTGDKVKQGQVIGIMGNSGGSKNNPSYKMAVHLHFEIHKGPWVSKQKNAVDPSKFIKFYSKGELAKMEQQIIKLESEVKGLKESLSDLLQAVEKTAVYTSDAKVSDYAAGALKFAVDVGLIKGDPSGNLNPHGVLTRQDFAVVMQRYHELTHK